MTMMNERHVSKRIDFTINVHNKVIVTKNDNVMKSVLHCIEFCGHRDDATNEDPDANLGNFKALVEFRMEAGDNVLRQHLENCKKNATYMSKTAQNDIY
jgi:hypothetical protein